MNQDYKIFWYHMLQIHDVHCQIAYSNGKYCEHLHLTKPKAELHVFTHYAEKGYCGKPETAIMRKPCFARVGLWLVYLRTWNLGRIPHHSLLINSGSLCLDYLYNVIYAEYPLSFRNYGILICAIQKGMYMLNIPPSLPQNNNNKNQKPWVLSL